MPDVRAIKEYQRDHGALPADMDALVPAYLPRNHFQSQRLYGEEYRMFAKYNHMISYSFAPGREGWQIHGPFANGPVPVSPVVIGASTKPAETIK